MRGKLLVIFLLLFTFFNVKADECENIFWYSYKEWTNYENLIDVSFKNEPYFINTTGLQVSTNVFGIFSYPKHKGSETFLGSSKDVGTYKSIESNPNFLSLRFHQPIKASEIEFEIFAYEKETGKKVELQVSKNVNTVKDLINESKVIARYNSEKREKLFLNDEILHNIYFYFDSNKEIEYTFSYLQINKYQRFEHKYWSSDKIDGSEIHQTTICDNDSKYIPDGTSGKWEKEVNVSFKRANKISGMSDPIFSKQKMIFDSGRGMHHQKYAAPNYLKEIDTLSNYIDSWESLGEKPYISFVSKAKDSDYLMVSENVGISYIVKPMYWSFNQEDGYANVVSNNKNWCQHVTGRNKSPCFKHFGHTKNTRSNLYDTQIIQYNNVYDPSFQSIVKAKYTIFNEDNQNISFNNNEEIFNTNLNTTGIWRIKATLEDGIGNIKDYISNKYFIDQDKPIIKYHLEQDSIRIEVDDLHSKVKSWNYSILDHNGNITYDSGEMMSNEKIIKPLSSKEFSIVTYAQDNVGNSSKKIENINFYKDDKIGISKIIAPIYEVGKKAKIYLSLKCESCTINEPENLSLLINDKLIKTIEVDKNDFKETIEYVTNKNDVSKFSMKYDNKDISFDIFEKTKRDVVGMADIMLEDIVVSVLDSFDSVQYLSENIRLEFLQDKKNYFSGEGIDHSVSVEYYNPCAIVDNYACVSSNELENYNEAYIEYPSGAETIKDEYKIDSIYRVPLIYNSKFSLPQVYADRKTGLIYSENLIGKDLIDAKRKWYTNPLDKKGTYKVSAFGRGFGVNLFNFILTNEYVIDKSYKDVFNIRFVEADDPFKNGMSKVWQDNISFFDNLSKKDPLYDNKVK
ncbi:MAG: hypothetical protein ACK5KQ_05965 [Anaerorhabdus sp.]